MLEQSPNKRIEEELIDQFEFDMNCYGLMDFVEQFRNDGTLALKAIQWSENTWMKKCFEKAYIAVIKTGYQQGLCSTHIPI